jgi:hypothetical protein
VFSEADQMSEATEKSSYISEALLIAAVPPIAYLFAFTFEAGYAYVFSIPLELISITLTSVFLAGGAILLIGLFLLIFLDFISMLLPDAPGPVGRVIATLVPLFLATLAYVFYTLGTPHSSSLPGLAVGWLVILFLQFAFPLITQRNKTSYPEKLAAQAELETSSILRSLARRFPQPYLLAYYMGLALCVIFYAGQSNAFRQRDFLVARTNPECIVLRVYGDRAICAAFDATAHRVYTEFTLMRLAETAPQEFTVKSIGPVIGPRYAPPPVTPFSTATPTVIFPTSGPNTPSMSP